MRDMILFSAPLIIIGGLAALAYPTEPLAVLIAQFGWIALEVVGFIVSAVLGVLRR